jgi:single-strand DNA-binding protein
MLNKVILIGNLTRDPETTFSKSGKPITKFGIANNQRLGKDKEKANFFDCVAFGQTAETIGKYLTKGRQILVEGSLAQSTWETKEGQKRNKVEIIVDRFDFMNSGKKKDPNASAPADTDPTVVEEDTDSPF